MSSTTAAFFTNPILKGFHPDPSICRVHDNFYLVTSSFAYYPGLPIYRSRDFVQWEIIGHALQRPQQISLRYLGVSKGIFAPTLRWHKGIFYLTCTVVDGIGNFIITATDPAGPWSDPVLLPHIDGIDPSLFIEEDDSACIVYNSVALNNRPKYNGHRTIRKIDFDLNTLATVGTPQILVDGGSPLQEQPRWIEGPHLYKRFGWYYLIAAEGGTGFDHAVVAFKSKAIDGPYEPSPHSLLTQRHLPSERMEPITSAGHADLVQLPNDKWMAVFLACRPYENDHYNTGRETFAVPVDWTGEWPVLNPGEEDICYRYPSPLPALTLPEEKFIFKDDFSGEGLKREWISLRNEAVDWYRLHPEQKTLALRLGKETCSGNGTPTFLGIRQPSHWCSALVLIDFSATVSNEKAGLCVFGNEDHFYFLALSIHGEKHCVECWQSIPVPRCGEMKLLQRRSIDAAPLFLEITAEGDVYHFHYATAEGERQILFSNADARLLSTATSGGFVGCVFALYATAMGFESSSEARFQNFVVEEG